MKVIVFLFFMTLISAINIRGAETNDFANAGEYLVALENATGQYEKGKSPDVSITKLFFPSGKMQFVLSYNFANPRVASLLKRIQKLKVSDSVSYAIPDYLSGQQKQKDMALRKANPEVAKPVPNLDGGFFPVDVSPEIKPDPMSAPLWKNEPGAAPPPGVPDLRKREGDQSAGKILSDEKVKKQSTPQPAAPVATVAAKESPSRFPIVPVAILAAVIVGVIVFLLRRKSP